MKNTPMVVEPVTLQGQSVRLEPLKMEHFDALWSIGQDPELWTWTPYQINTGEKMRTYLRAALDGQELGVALPFVTIEQETDRVVGSTRFGNIDVRNRRVEASERVLTPSHIRYWAATRLSKLGFKVEVEAKDPLEAGVPVVPGSDGVLPGIDEALTYTLTRAQIHARSVRLATMLSDGAWRTEAPRRCRSIAKKD